MARPPVNAVFILWLRQLKLYFRSRARVIGALGQPTLFLLSLRGRFSTRSGRELPPLKALCAFVAARATELQSGGARAGSDLLN